MKKFFLTTVIALMGLIAFSQYTYDVNKTVYDANTGAMYSKVYVKVSGTPDQQSDSLIHFEYAAFADRYAAIIYNMNGRKQSMKTYKTDSLPPDIPTEGYIRMIEQSVTDTTSKSIWADYVGFFALYTDGGWLYYTQGVPDITDASQRAIGSPFAVAGVRMKNRNYTGCPKLDGACFVTATLGLLKTDFATTNVTLLADPSGNTRD